LTDKQVAVCIRMARDILDDKLVNKGGAVIVNFTSQDIAIIERALRAAMQSEKQDSRAEDYREVLQKLQEANASEIKALDGIRFDYDDSSDIL
jgi:putative heme iron utilization protein